MKRVSLILVIMVSTLLKSGILAAPDSKNETGRRRAELCGNKLVEHKERKGKNGTNEWVEARSYQLMFSRPTKQQKKPK